MSGLACLKCKVFLTPKKSGTYVEEGMPLTRELDGPWGPYKLWSCDLAECPKCGVEIITGFGYKPLAEHFHPDYADKAKRYQPICRIDACSGYKP